jgi:hypothetical protein
LVLSNENSFNLSAFIEDGREGREGKVGRCSGIELP